MPPQMTQAHCSSDPKAPCEKRPVGVDGAELGFRPKLCKQVRKLLKVQQLQ